MNEILVKSGVEIDLGKRGEHLARCIVFDISGWQKTYGDGSVHLLHQRNGDKAPYPCVVETDGPYVRWLLSETDVDVAGRGRAELQYFVDEARVKSETWNTRTNRSMNNEGPIPEEPAVSWLNTMLQLGTETQENAEIAEQSAEIAKQSAEMAKNSEAYVAGVVESVVADALDEIQASVDTATESAEIARTSSAEAQESAEAAEANALSASASEQAAKDAQAAAEQARDDAQSIAGGDFVPTSRKVNGKPLSSDVTLTAADVDAVPITGGTIRGNDALLFAIDNAINGGNSYMGFAVNGAYKSCAGYYNGFAFLSNETGNFAKIGVTDKGVPQFWPSNSAGDAKELLHSGNFSNYAVKKAGDKMAGNLTVEKSTPAMKLSDTANNFLSSFETGNHFSMVTAQNSPSSTQDYRALMVCDSTSDASLAGALKLRDKAAGTVKNYNVYHTGNKPTAADVGATNPNLLINWYFGDPVNQRDGLYIPPNSVNPDIRSYTDTALTTGGYEIGDYRTVTVKGTNSNGVAYVGWVNNGVTYYTQATNAVKGYASALNASVKHCDCWGVYNGRVYVNNGYITFVARNATDPLFIQRIKGTPLFGKYTMSIMLNDGTVHSGTVSFDRGLTGYEYVTAKSFTANGATWTLDIRHDPNGYYYDIRCGTAGEQSLDIKAIKVEYGSAQTLAHLENGVWKLNETPNKWIELLKCVQDTGSASDTYANKVIYHSGNKPTATDVGALPVSLHSIPKDTASSFTFPSGGTTVVFVSGRAWASGATFSFIYTGYSGGGRHNIEYVSGPGTGLQYYLHTEGGPGFTLKNAGANGEFAVTVAVLRGDGPTVVSNVESPAGLVSYGNLTPVTNKTATVSTSWTASGSYFYQDVAVTGILATDTPIIGINPGSDNAANVNYSLAMSNVFRITTSANSIRLWARSKPTVAFPIQIKVVR